MTQTERRLYLIAALLKEQPQFSKIEIPSDKLEQKRLLRSLFNIRMPKPVTEEFLMVQNAYLQEEIRRKGITELSDLEPVSKEIYLWRGDITTLKCDAIVNAANSQMLGCFCPNHGCIDNAIHTFAGVQLRLACRDLMEQQGHEEETGKAKITPAYNLPSRYVIHTVGPIVYDGLAKKGSYTKANVKTAVDKFMQATDDTEKLKAAKNLVTMFNGCSDWNETLQKAAKVAQRYVNEHKDEA